jgi:hypothetical protein
MTVRSAVRRAAGIAGCALAIGTGGVAATPAAAAPASASTGPAAAVASAAMQPRKCMVSPHFCIYRDPQTVCGYPSLAVSTTRPSCPFIAGGRAVVRVVNHTARRMAYYSKDGYRGQLGTLLPGRTATLKCRCQVRSFRAVG